MSYPKSPEHNALLIFNCNIHLPLKLGKCEFQEEVLARRGLDQAREGMNCLVSPYYEEGRGTNLGNGGSKTKYKTSGSDNGNTIFSLLDQIFFHANMELPKPAADPSILFLFHN